MATNNMNGWDVVSIVTIPFVNDAIRTQGSSPTSMYVSTDTLEVDATFAHWQITTGGGPDLLIFNLPLTSITGVVSKDGQTITQFHYQHLAARVQLVLKFIDSGIEQDLVVDDQHPPTSVVSLLDDKGQPLAKINSLDDAFIKEALTHWLDQNLSQFNHVFASLSLDPGVDSASQWAFCKPSIMAYTLISRTSLADSYLGLMYNTAGNMTPGTTAQIDPSFIPPGCEAAFMLSPAMFLEKFLARSTESQFKMASHSLAVDKDHMRIDLHPGQQIGLPLVSGPDNGPVQPMLNGMTIIVENSVINMYATTSTVVLDEWYGSVTAHCRSESWLALGLNASKQGLVYTRTQPSINNHDIENSPGFELVQKVLELIGIIVVAVATALTDGAALLVAGAIIGLVGGGFEFVLAEFDSEHKDDAPEINNLASNLSLPVTWTSAGPFVVSQAGLHHGAFFLAGKMREGSSN